MASHPGEADLEARIQTYELAAAMQTAAKDALDTAVKRGNEQLERFEKANKS